MISIVHLKRYVKRRNVQSNRSKKGNQCRTRMNTIFAQIHSKSRAWNRVGRCITHLIVNSWWHSTCRTQNFFLSPSLSLFLTPSLSFVRSHIELISIFLSDSHSHSTWTITDYLLIYTALRYTVYWQFIYTRVELRR